MKTPKKIIAYLILAHNQPAFLAKLIAQLQHPEVCFFVHIDKKVNQNLFSKNIKSLKNVFFIEKREKITWAHFSIVAKTFSLIECAKNSIYSFKYFVLLSGSCFPIKSNNKIIRFFQNTSDNYIDSKNISTDYLKYKRMWKRLQNNKAFKNVSKNKNINRRIESFHHKNFSSMRLQFFWKTGIQLFRFFPNLLKNNLLLCYFPFLYRMNTWFFLFKKDNHYTRLLALFLNIFYPKKHHSGIKYFYSGIQWWFLNETTIQFLLDFFHNKKNKNILNYFYYSFCPDELFFQTVLENFYSKSKIIRNLNSIRYLKFVGSSPEILIENDYNTLKKSEALFARKFDEKQSNKLIEKIQKNINN